MDSRTVYALSSVCLAATATLVAVAARSYPRELCREGFRWTAAVALLAAGMGLVAVRGLVPDGLSILGAHGASVAGLSGLHHSLSRFVGARWRPRWIYLPLPVAVASAAFFYFVFPSYALRVGLFSAITGVQMGLCAWVLARGQSPAPRTSRLASFGFAGCSVLLLVRTWDSLRIDPTAAPEAIFRASLLEQAIVVGLFVGFFALSFSFVILCNEKLNRDLVQQATTDALTGCANRRTIEEAALREAARARRHGSSLAVALIDLDRLKRINDLHGHAAGDAALRFVSSTLVRTLRSQDLVGRYGGDELLLVMPETSPEEALAACSRFREAVAAQPVEHEGALLAFSVSVGIGCARGAEADLAAVLRVADAALYAAKATGGDAVKVAAVAPPADVAAVQVG